MGKIPETRSQEISLIFQKKNKLKWEWNLKNILDWLIGGYWHLPIPSFTASVDFGISWHPCWQDSCVTMHAYMLSRFSRVWLFVTLWTVGCQAPLSMESPRQEYWSGLSFPPPGNLPDSGIEPTSLMSPALAGGFFITSATWEAISKDN